MANLYTHSKELIWVRNKDPEKVIVERNDIHHFYWRFEINSLLDPTKPDFEPIMVSSAASIAVSRVHWEGLIVWISPIYHLTKPVTDFYTDNHTPVLLINTGDARRVGDPKQIETRIYLNIFVQPLIRKMLNGRYDISLGSVRGYIDKFTVNIDIPDDSKLLHRTYNFVIIVGDRTKMDKISRLREILSDFRFSSTLSDALFNLLRPNSA